MSRSSAAIPLALLVFSALIVLSSPACTVFEIASTNPPDKPATTTNLLAPSSPVDVQLSLSQAPKLNDTAELKCTVNLAEPADNVRIKIELPAGIECVSGNLNWNGDIPEGGTSNPDNFGDQVEKKVELTAVIRPITAGIWDIRGVAWYQIGEGYWDGDAIYLFLKVESDSAEILSMLPPPDPDWGRTAEPLALEFELSMPAVPALNETTQATCIAHARPNPTYSTTLPATVNVTTRIILPEGFTLVSGDLILSEDLPTNTESQLEMNAIIRATETGTWEIYGNATQIDLYGSTVGSGKSINVIVGETQAESSFVPETSPIFTELPLLTIVRLYPFQEPPLLNQPTEMTWILETTPNPDWINNSEATCNVSVEIVLPPSGFSSANDNPIWSGVLPTDTASRVEINTEITVIQTGYWIIIAHATQTDLEGNSSDSWNTLGLEVSDDHSNFMPAPEYIPHSP